MGPAFGLKQYRLVNNEEGNDMEQNTELANEPLTMEQLEALLATNPEGEILITQDDEDETDTDRILN